MNNRVPFCDASFSNGGGIDRTFSSRAPAGVSRKEYNKMVKERDEAL